MKTIFKILILMVIIGTGFYLLGYDDVFPYLYDFLHSILIFIIELPIIKNIIDDFPHYTVSGLITIAVVLLGISYAIIHFFEMLIKGLASMVGRRHTPFKSKQKVKKLFHSAIVVKLLLLVFKLVITITKAWSLSQFFHWLIGDPIDVWQLIKNDVLFFIVLAIILLISLYKRRQTQKQYITV